MESLDSILTEQMYIVVILSIVFFLFACAGITVFITYMILNRYSDFGKVSVCSIHQYSNDGINYTVIREKALLDEKMNSYFYMVRIRTKTSGIPFRSSFLKIPKKQTSEKADCPNIGSYILIDFR